VATTPGLGVVNSQAPCSGLQPSPHAHLKCQVATLSCSLWLSHLQDGRFHLRVFIQAVLPNGRVDIAQDVTLICPKPDHTVTPDPYLAPPTTPEPFTPHAFALHPIPDHTLAGSGHTGLTTLYPEQSFIHPTPAPPSLGPGPAGSTVPHSQWGTLEPWELTELDSVGMWAFSVYSLCLGTFEL
jgi:hypothetical protein